MYYIEQRKIPLKYAFFREQCLVFPRDIRREHGVSPAYWEELGTYTPVLSSGGFGNSFNQIAGTPHGPHA